YLPHQAGRNSEEVRAILTGHIAVNQTQVRFVDQSRGLQGMTRSLAAHVVASQASQFVFNDRDQPVERDLIAFPPFKQQLGHLPQRVHRRPTSLSSGFKVPESEGLIIPPQSKCTSIKWLPKKGPC